MHRPFPSIFSEICVCGDTEQHISLNIEGNGLKFNTEDKETTNNKAWDGIFYRKQVSPRFFPIPLARFLALLAGAGAALAIQSMEGHLLGSIVAILAVSLTGTFLSPLEPEKKRYALRIQLLFVFLLLMFLMSRFLWFRVTGSFSQKSRTSKFARLLLMVILGLGNSSIIIGHFFIGPEPYFLTILSYLCLGFMVLTFLNILVWNALLSMLSHLKFPWQQEKVLKQVKVYIALMSLVVSFLMCVSGWYTATGKSKMVDVSIPISKLPLTLNGTRIVQLSDIHLGPTVGKSMLEDVVTMVMAKKPEVIVITGDLIDSSEKSLVNAAAPLGKLEARHGVFFVTGNHEYIAGNVDIWFKELKKLGITPLHNERVKVSDSRNPENFFYLAGVDDIQANSFMYPGHGMNLHEALRNRQPKYPTILLAHQPQAAKLALREYKDIDLILSGHTHGGQFFPLHIPIYLWNPFFAGLYRQEGTWIYVSSGTKYWGIPLRIGSQPEITIITLKKE